MKREAMLLVLGLGIMATLAACGSSAGSPGSGSGGGVNNSIDSFIATPSLHKLGEQVSFSWSVTNPGSYSCSLDVDGDGVADDYHILCPSTGSFDYTYESAGVRTAEFYLGPISDPVGSESAILTTSKRYVIASYYRLNVIKDCDAGTAGAGEFGWDLFINGTLLSSVNQNNAVAISDGQYVNLSSVSSNLEISTLSDTISFSGHIYEYDNGSMIDQPFTLTFDKDQNWGIQDIDKLWVKRFDISSSCNIEISVSVYE